MVAAHISSLCHFLPRVNMAKPVRESLMPWSQQGSTEEPETNVSVSQQEGQTNATEDKVIVNYNSNIDYEGSEPKIKPFALEEKENMQT